MRSNTKGTRLIKAVIEAAEEAAFNGAREAAVAAEYTRHKMETESRLIQYVLDLESQVRAKEKSNAK